MHPVAVSRHGVLLASDLRNLGFDARALQRAAQCGKLHRLRRGAYVDPAQWSELDDRSRYLLRLRAVDGTRSAQSTFSHASAAALHGLPILGRWPSTVHLVAEKPGRSRNGVSYHRAIAGRTTTVVDGLECTSLVDTLIDLARESSFRSAVISIDHALHTVAVAAAAGRRTPAAWREAAHAAAAFKTELLDAFHRFAPRRNFRSGLLAIDFASHLSDSPGNH